MDSKSVVVQKSDAWVFLKDTIQKQKFELYFPFSDTDCLMLKFPIDFKDNNIMHR